MSERGGARLNAGRKKLPVTEVKKPLTVHVSDIEASNFGGRESLKKHIANLIRSKQ